MSQTSLFLRLPRAVLAKPYNKALLLSLVYGLAACDNGSSDYSTEDLKTSEASSPRVPAYSMQPALVESLYLQKRHPDFGKTQPQTSVIEELKKKQLFSTRKSAVKTNQPNRTQRVSRELPTANLIQGVETSIPQEWVRPKRLEPTENIPTNDLAPADSLNSLLPSRTTLVYSAPNSPESSDSVYRSPYTETADLRVFDSSVSESQYGSIPQDLSLSEVSPSQVIPLQESSLEQPVIPAAPTEVFYEEQREAYATSEIAEVIELEPYEYLEESFEAVIEESDIEESELEEPENTEDYDDNRLYTAAANSNELYIEDDFNFDLSRSVGLYFTVNDNLGRPLANRMMKVYAVPENTNNWDDLIPEQMQLVLLGKTNSNGLLDKMVELPATAKKLLVVVGAIGIENKALLDINSEIVSYYF